LSSLTWVLLWFSLEVWLWIFLLVLCLHWWLTLLGSLTLWSLVLSHWSLLLIWWSLSLSLEISLSTLLRVLSILWLLIWFIIVRHFIHTSSHSIILIILLSHSWVLSELTVVHHSVTTVEWHSWLVWELVWWWHKSNSEVREDCLIVIGISTFIKSFSLWVNHLDSSVCVWFTLFEFFSFFFWKTNGDRVINLIIEEVFDV